MSRPVKLIPSFGEEYPLSLIRISALKPPLKRITLSRQVAVRSSLDGLSMLLNYPFGYLWRGATMREDEDNR